MITTQEVKNLLQSMRETYYAQECFKRIYEIDKADPARQRDLETNLSLQETYDKLLTVGGFRYMYDETVDTRQGYIAPKRPEEKKEEKKLEPTDPITLEDDE